MKAGPEGSRARPTRADAAPALGTVAAVVVVSRTLAHTDAPPAVLGGMIAGALTGTFLGVLLAYGLAAPIASRVASSTIDALWWFELLLAITS